MFHLGYEARTAFGANCFQFEDLGLDCYEQDPHNMFMNYESSNPSTFEKSSLNSPLSESQNEDDYSSPRDTDTSSPSDKKVISKGKATKGKRVWDEEDEALLLNLGTLYKNDWKKIAKRIYKLRKIKKTPSWLRKRFKQVRTLPGKKRQKFTHEEDLKLIAAIDEIGMNWIKIAETFPNREAIMLKNRYYSHIRKYNLIDELLDELHKKEEEEESLQSESETKAPETNAQPVPEKVVPSQRDVDFSEIDMFFAGREAADFNQTVEQFEKIQYPAHFNAGEEFNQPKLWNFLSDYWIIQDIQTQMYISSLYITFFCA